jgi:cytochrome P450
LKNKVGNGSAGRLAREKRFPVGREITLAELDRDPYPAFERLRQYEPISWVAALNMWYIVGYEHARTALFDTSRLTTESAQSTILDTFGAHILTTEGATHERYRQALRHPFTPAFIRTHLEAAIGAAATALIDGFEKQGQVDVRSVFAGRLPIQVILLACGRHGELHAWRRQSRSVDLHGPRPIRSGSRK